MKNKKDVSKILGIVSLATGWGFPLAGVVCGIVGLCVKKQEKNYNLDIALNVIGIVVAFAAWVVWMNILI